MKLLIPGYTEPLNRLMCGFPGIGYGILAEGSAVPTDATAGYEEGCLFFKRSGTAGAQLYINEGSVSSCAFKALPTQAATGTAGLAVTGVAAGYKIARGVTALDGSNPTPVTTGLTTVVSATLTLEGSSAPGVGTSVLTQASTNWATGALAVYAWKVTSNADPTLVASTGTENFDWIAVGT